MARIGRRRADPPHPGPAAGPRCSAAAAADVAALIAAELGWTEPSEQAARSTPTAPSSTPSGAAPGLPVEPIARSQPPHDDAATTCPRPVPASPPRRSPPRRRSRRPPARLDAHLRATCPRRCSTALAAICPVDHGTAMRRRGQPRLVAPGDDLGPRRPGRRRSRRRRLPHDGRGGRRRAGACATTPRIPVTAAAGRSGVCGASVPVHGGVVLDLCGLTGIVDVDATSLVLDVRAGHLRRPASSTTLRHDHGLTLGPLAAVGGPVDRRRLAGLPSRRPAVHPLRQDRGHGAGPRRRPGRRAPDQHRRCAPRRGRPGPQPALRRLGGHARHHHRRPPAPAPRADPRAAGGLRVRVVRRRHRRHAPHPAARRHARRRCASTTPRRPIARYHTGDRALLLVLDKGDGAVVDATMELVAEVCRDGAPRGRRAHVEHWLEQRNDVAALEALITRGYVVDTMEVVGRWRDLPADLRGHHRGAQQRPGHDRRVGPPVPQLPRRAAASTSPSPPGRARRPRRATTARCGTPDRERCSAPAARCRHHHGVGLNRSRFVAEALGPGVRRAGRDQGRARPERHPQPRQARPALPVRRHRL